MTPKAQRIAIAELCDIYICDGCNHEINLNCCWCGSAMKNHGYQDGHSGVPMGCTCGYDKAEKMVAKEPECPDYLNDLNAIHKALPILDNPKYNSFISSRPYDYAWVRFESALVEILKIRTFEEHVLTKPDANGKRIELMHTQYGRDSTQKFILATAAQLSEALLKATNKWKSSK